MIDETSIPASLMTDEEYGEMFHELLKIACLYHDIGKLDTKEEEGHKGHAEAGAELFSAEIALELDLDESKAHIVGLLIKNHLGAFDYIRNIGKRPTEPIECIGVFDLIACYMEHWMTLDDVLVPKRWVTPQLKSLRDVNDPQNHHVTDMLTHSVLCFHVCEKLTEDRDEEEDINYLLEQSVRRGSPPTNIRKVGED